MCCLYVTTNWNAIAERTVQKFADDFKLEDQNILISSLIINEDQIESIESNSRYTYKLPYKLKISKSIIHFVKLNYINRFDVLVSHDLMEKI